ncbi:MAG: LuxR C-terminal-related transcriptional regulator [Caldilineaceae bacterium]
MSTSILATKLYIPPPRPKVVPRPHLIERLNAGLAMGHKLTLISASAGFGKTTLVSEWIAHCGKPVAWLSLDERDNDPVRFTAYLVAALQTIQPGIGEGLLAALQSSQPPPTDAILTTLLNEISVLSEQFLFILDDYHLIDGGGSLGAVDQALAFLVEHQPPQMHVVIATREDPSLPLARLRARGQLTELRTADLQFTPAEAVEFFNRAMGLNLSAEEIATLETRTEGWIAGLQLAALALQGTRSLQGHQDATSFIKSFTGSHRFVLDYLLEEVLQQQPATIQTFLLCTSILDRMCGPLCDAILLDPSVSGQDTLETLERANLFIVPLDNERHWYRYHHLFSDLLRQRLGKPKEFTAFHLRASQWHEKNGDLGAAFHHAIAAVDFIRAAELAEAAWQGMEESFQTAAWLGWVKKLPEEVIRVRPLLCTLLGRAFADAGEPEASELRLQDAERCLDGSGVATEAQFKPLLATIALTRAYNAQVQGKLATAVKYAEQAVQLIPEHDVYRRAQAAITLQATHWASGNLESAVRAIGDWMERMTQLGNHVFVVASAFGVADLLVGLGRLSEAERVYQDALQLAAQHGPQAEHITAHHHLGLSMIYRQRGADTLAAQHLQRAAELGLQTTLADWPYRWHVAQAQLKEATGDLESALALLDEAERAYVQTVVPDLRPIVALKARIYLKQGRPDKARAWAAEHELSLADEVSYLHEFEHLTLARLEIADPQVNALLARLLQAAEAQKRRGSALDILLVQALAHEAQYNRPQALAALESALALAEPEGYVRIFVDEGEAMRLLIADCGLRISHRSLDAYVERLLLAFPQAKPAPPQFPGLGAIRNPQSELRNLLEPLSARELEVLKLLRSELSGPEIAQQLIVSLNTLRTHTNNIFKKLGVNNRRAAIRRAEELDLL